MDWLQLCVVWVIAASAGGCWTAAAVPRPGVHHVVFDGDFFASRDEVIDGWHARAAATCGDANYEVVSTLTDPNLDAYREGGRIDERGRVSVPGIIISGLRAEGLVRCGPLSDDAVLELADASMLSPDACRTGDASACIRAANSRRAAGDESRALTYFSRACRAGEPSGCIEVGSALEARNAFDRDLELAADFYKQGCKLGRDEACEAFARARASSAASR